MVHHQISLLAALAATPATAIVADAAFPDSLRQANPSTFQATTRYSSLDSIKAELNRQIALRQGKHYGCSAISLTSLASTLGSPFTEQQLRSLSDSFAGGIGHEFADGTCGALSGAVMALGFYASGDKDKHLKLAAEVYDELKKQEGTVKCGDIYGKYGFKHCDGCILCAVQKVVEVLYREGDIQKSTIAPWQQQDNIENLTSNN